MPLDGETDPRPCDCCAYGLNAATRAGELEALNGQLSTLEEALDTDEGKKQWVAFVRKHKHKHSNVGPGTGFTPVISTTLNDW
eukprot:851047-Pleurochrysis_carterae.AAC.1